MEPNELFSIICGGSIILIIIGIIFIVIIALVIRAIIRRTRRKVGIPKGTGKVIRQQLANIDQYIQNDPRQTKQWQSTTPPHEAELDLDDIDVDDFPSSEVSRKEEAKTVMPNWTNDTLTCSGCGAPQRPEDRVCPYCGHKHG